MGDYGPAAGVNVLEQWTKTTNQVPRRVRRWRMLCEQRFELSTRLVVVGATFS